MNCQDFNLQQTASTVADSFETLLEAYHEIGEQLPLLQEYEELFKDNPYMIQALESMYIDILEFHQQAIRFFSGSSMSKQISVLTRVGLTVHRMAEVLSRHVERLRDQVRWHQKSLARHKDLVERRATISQYRLYQLDMVEMKKNFDELLLEERDKKLVAVREWFAVGSIQDDHHTSFNRIRATYRDTTRWIMKNDKILDWMDSDSKQIPSCSVKILSLTGVPKIQRHRYSGSPACLELVSRNPASKCPGHEH